MTALRTYRHDLADHLADGLDITATDLGAQVNPPTVVVQPSSSYVTAVDYCVDGVLFDVSIITKPGDPAAEMDALDDLVDGVRSTLRNRSAAGYLYSFQGVTGRVAVSVGDRDFPAVIATVRYERATP